MLHQAQANLQAAGVADPVADPIGAAVADAGYWNANEIREVSQGGVELFVATTNDRKQRQAFKEASSPDTEASASEPLDLKEEMHRKLLTQRGKEVYGLRGQTVEPVFEQTSRSKGYGAMTGSCGEASWHVPVSGSSSASRTTS